MEAIILAGGMGTRLAARVSGVPKAMAPVGGRPFLEILLEQLGRCGCARVVLAVGYLHAAIEDYFGAAFGAMKLDYAVEESLLGTGGAIRKALEMAREHAILTLNGDTFLEADFAEMLRFHGAAGAAMTMAVTPQADVARYGGVVIHDGRVVDYQEKGRTGAGWINAGAYVLNRNIQWPQELPERFSFEKDFLVPRIAEITPAAFEVKGFFLDIGVPEDFDRAQTELARF